MESVPQSVDTRSSEHHGLIYRAFERALLLLNGFGTIWIFVLMFLICADVVARSFFNHPIDGVTDIAAFSIIGIVFLQIGATVHTGRMTKGDVFLEIIAKRSRKIGALLESLFLGIGALMFILVVRSGWPQLTQSIERNQFFGVEGVFTFPTWPIRLIIVVGAAAAAIAYFLQISQLLYRAFAADGGAR